MGYVLIQHRYTYASVQCVNRYFYYNETSADTLTQMSALCAAFNSNVVAAVNGIQSTIVSNDPTYVSGLNSGVSIEASPGAGGLITGTAANTLPPKTPLLIAVYGGQNYEINTNLIYNGSRPLQRGNKYISGLLEEWSSATGLSVPVDAADELDAVLDAIQAPLSILSGTITYVPILVGLALPATPPTPAFPSGKPIRPAVRAQVNAAGAVDISTMKTRKT